MTTKHTLAVKPSGKLECVLSRDFSNSLINLFSAWIFGPYAKPAVILGQSFHWSSWLRDSWLLDFFLPLLGWPVHCVRLHYVVGWFVVLDANLYNGPQKLTMGKDQSLIKLQRLMAQRPSAGTCRVPVRSTSWGWRRGKWLVEGCVLITQSNYVIIFHV